MMKTPNQFATREPRTALDVSFAAANLMKVLACQENVAIWTPARAILVELVKFATGEKYLACFHLALFITAVRPVMMVQPQV
jgi:hypothetical protein